MIDEKKIIVDEDWKSRVAAEREAASRHEGAQPAADGGDRPPPKVAAATEGSRPRPQLPPASFDLLVTGFVTEAMVALGQLPHPVSGQFDPDQEQARYAIDMLDVLAEKTKGNLEPAEERGLREVLHQLRMAFISFGLPADN